jgi:aspartyl-tRNA(Asn)/glutamyl-tRNA(Gln) amidotransferase subunit B
MGGWRHPLRSLTRAVGRMAKDLALAMAGGDRRLAPALAQERGWVQDSDAVALAALVARLVAAHPQQADAVRGGRPRVLGWFVGQALQATRGQGNPAVLTRLFREHLGLAP